MGYFDNSDALDDQFHGALKDVTDELISRNSIAESLLLGAALNYFVGNKLTPYYNERDRIANEYKKAYEAKDNDARMLALEHMVLLLDNIKGDSKFLDDITLANEAAGVVKDEAASVEAGAKKVGETIAETGKYALVIGAILLVAIVVIAAKR